MAQQTFAASLQSDDLGVYKTGSTVYPPNTTVAWEDIATINVDRFKFSATNFEVECGLLRIDTSGLPDDALITGATLQLVGVNKTDTDSLSVTMGYYQWDGSSASDFTNGVETSAHTGTALSAISVGADTYTDFTLTNVSNISKTGYTYFRLTMSQLASDAPPTSGNLITFRAGTSLFPPTLVVDYTTNTERLSPNAEVSKTGYTSGAYTDADEDPTGTLDGVKYTAADPSSSTQDDSARYADAQDGTTPSGYAGQLTSPANAVGSGETTQATSTGATQNSNYGTYFGFDETAIAAAIPSNATINSVTVDMRDWVSNTNRSTTGVNLHSAAGTAIATEQTVTNLSTTVPGAGAAKRSLTGWSTTPTRAQLVAAGFRVLVRYQRTASQACTYTLDWLRLVINYTIPASTTATSVRFGLTSLTSGRQLKAGAGLQTVRIAVSKKGSGTSPTVDAKVYNSTTLIATPISAQSVSSATSTLYTGTWDSTGITPTDGANLELEVVSAGAAGGLVEVDAADILAQYDVSGGATGFPFPTQTVQRILMRR